jgi:hypothetical protein
MWIVRVALQRPYIAIQRRRMNASVLLVKALGGGCKHDSSAAS